ncbi:hypothetical protein Pmani_029470 [Petrolisthes manimaculis]|uniref:Large ribosomal subunit protein mL64 n=1 Tax=Petrolisthes manimaculis TaxID=1843537 RepID=A0AAE1NYM2_9EUCA|nr:hypothetical protein Pmani_029470 [Petrolisthes manimaculis]
MLSRGSVRLRVCVRASVSADPLTLTLTPPTHTPRRPSSTLPLPPPRNPYTPRTAQREEDVIERKRNKSQLTPWHYNKQHYKPPQPLTEDEEAMECLKTQRSLFGHYGSRSGINPSKAWPSKEELALEREWERVAHPHTVQHMIDISRKERQEEQMIIKQRQDDISRKLLSLEKWKNDLNTRVAKQEKLAREAKEKKERLIDEVRDILGFRVDPRDERFKEALELKEKEEKKRSKAAKKLAKEQRMLDQLRKEVEGKEEEKEGDKDDGEKEGDEGKSLHGKVIV